MSATTLPDGQVTYDIPKEAQKKLQEQNRMPTQEEIDALELTFSYEDKTEKVKNIYIQLKNSKLNCRNSYGGRFTRIKVMYSCESIMIIATGSKDEDGYMFIPTHNVMTVGVDIIPEVVKPE